MLGTALILATVITAELPPPPLVDAELPAPEVYSPPPLVEAVDHPVVVSAPAAEVRSAPKLPVEEPRRPMFGVALDAAAPDGAGVNLMLRPANWIELHAGVAHNAITPGFRGGVTLLPSDHWYAPTLTVELGTHPPGDANELLHTIIGNDALSFDELDSVGYDYANALLGFTLGSREHFTLYLRGGVTRVVGRSESSSLVAAPSGSSGSGTGTAATAEPVTLILPAIKAGFAIYFF